MCFGNHHLWWLGCTVGLEGLSMNESAFPTPVHNLQNDGMNLRDYFAAKALQGLLANPKLQNEILKQGGCHSGWIEVSAWAFADEMMKARNK
jgi:hypothetical protein